MVRKHKIGKAEIEFEKAMMAAMKNPGDTDWVDDLPEEPDFDAGDTAVIFVKDKKKSK